MEYKLDWDAITTLIVTVPDELRNGDIEDILKALEGKPQFLIIRDDIKLNFHYKEEVIAQIKKEVLEEAVNDGLYVHIDDVDEVYLERNS